MRKIKFTDSLNSIYSVSDEITLRLKSNVINLCSNIDRYYRLKYKIKIWHEIDDTAYNKIQNNFPFTKQMPLDLYNKLRQLYLEIRDINAHMFLLRPLLVSSDLEQYITSELNPSYAISVNGQLTAYGQAFIIGVMAQKYNLHTFIFAYFRPENFIEIAKLDDTKRNEFHLEQITKIENFCGKGKPINFQGGKEYSHMLNDVFKTNMTKILFALEKNCLGTSKSYEYAWSIARCLSLKDLFRKNKNITDIIVFLRNCWLHGNNLYDIITYKEEQYCLSPKLILSCFIEIKKCLKKEAEEYKEIIDSLDDFAYHCYRFYCLRFVELTYKVLDKRILEEEKLTPRMEKLDINYHKILEEDEDFFVLAEKLLDESELKISLRRELFLDNVARQTNCQQLKIVKIYSNNGFKIGDYYTEKKDLYIAIIDLDNKNENAINGHYLKEYQLKEEKKIGEKIIIYTGLIANNN